LGYQANVIADSVCPAGIRITTIHLRYPRIVHSEFMTHRVFSRNARSSRAVPTKVLLEEVARDPVIPAEWGKNRRGMQATEEVDHEAKFRAEWSWLRARDAAVSVASELADLGVHKQIVNRLLEPFSWIDVLVTSTDWANFLALRDHPDAQPEMRTVARMLSVSLDESSPEPLGIGDWHLPYIAELDRREFAVGSVSRERLGPAMVSAARCRRISYRPFDGESSVEADLKRFDEMVEARPLHASPMEHQAMATGDPRVRSGNFRGWIQFRQTLRGHDVAG
jgi:hypothetical protein